MSKENSIKICLIGDSGVGKTAISNCIAGEKFVENGPPTIGSSYHFHSIKVGDESLNLKIVDTAGQERFRSITKQHFRDSVGALLVFDITERSSFEALDEWLNNFHQYACPNAVCILIGNKKDLADRRMVQTSEAEEFSIRYNLTYVETSANRICRVLLTIELDHSATPCCFFCGTDIPFYNTLHALCNKYNRKAAYWQKGRETKRFNSVTLEHCQMGDGEEEGQQQRCNSSSTEIL